MRFSTLFAASTLCLAPLLGRAQTPITINQNDMPNVGDTLRLSQGIPSPTLNYQQTGANQTWDFSQLIPTSQNVRGFVSVSSTGGIFPFIFGNLGGVNRASIATPVQLPLDSLPGGLALGTINGFFFESAQDFRQVGYGASLNGLPVPVTFNSQAEQDVFYRFPLTFGSQDSSFSAFQVDVPNTAFLAQSQKRVNRCDGWGTLTTPFGTFPTVRVVTTLDTYDSLALNGQTPIAFQIPTRREYKWIAKNQGIPLLTITTTLVAGNETLTGVEYRDIYRIITFPTAVAPDAALSQVTLSPNPVASGQPVVLRGLPAGATVEVFDALGRLLVRKAATASEISLATADLGTARGVLTVRATAQNGTAVRRLVRD